LARSSERVLCTGLLFGLLLLAGTAYAQTPSELLSSIEQRLQRSVDYSTKLEAEVRTWRASSMKSEEAALALKDELQKQSEELGSLKIELASLKAELESWPPRYEEIKKQASALLDLVRQLQEKVKQLSENFESTVLSWRLALTDMTRERDIWRVVGIGGTAVAVVFFIVAMVK